MQQVLEMKGLEIGAWNSVYVSRKYDSTLVDGIGKRHGSGGVFMVIGGVGCLDWYRVCGRYCRGMIFVPVLGWMGC